jgi:hypothetical protein
MGIFGKSKRPESEADRIYADVERERTDAERAHEQANVAADAAKRAFEAAEEALFRVEGDCLIGRVPPERLEAARIAAADAKLAVTRTAAEVRETERRVLVAKHAVTVYQPQFVVAKLTGYHTRHAEIAARLLAALTHAASINDELRANFSAAEEEFPQFYLPFYEAQRHGRNATRPYPVNAGLTNLAWGEFRHNPHAVNGGRLGTFRKRVEEFLRDSDGILKAYGKGGAA